MKTIIQSAFILAVFCPVFCYSQAAGDFRSFASGNWNAVTTWERFDGVSWINPAPSTPISSDGAITIQAPHTVTINAAISIDQVTIDAGAILQNTTGGTVTIANGTGIDLQINGTFIEALTATFTFTGTWAMGANGTLVKTSASASNNWQTTYDGGITNIPATSNWILRKVGSSNPVISSAGAIYPNLIIENNTGTTWTMAAGSTFTGTTVSPVIKGNFDIGGSGTGFVSFLNDFKNPTTCVQVQGDMTVRTGNTYRNYGTGTEIQGKLICNGTIAYDGADGRKLVFSGTSTQSVSGTGTLGIYDMTMSKTGGDLTLNRAITVNNLLTLTSGIINSSATNLLTIGTSGSVTGASNSSFVAGPVRYIGNNAIVFPTGKGSDYQAIGISASNVFWTETFSNACASNCTAAAYSGSNGAWSLTSIGTQGTSANNWFVSGSECGNSAGSCGSSCSTTDPSLHVGCLPVAFICSGGDCGAAYNAGSASSTNRRAESPLIDCSLYSDIVLSFNYIGKGQSCSTDYCDLQISTDGGTTWSNLQTCLTATTCSGGQGSWTNYSVVLPAAANNNPNVKIGFHWVNNGDNAGSDPSFAVDDITLSPLVDFTAEYFYANPQVPYGNTLASPLTTLSSCEYWILNRNAGTQSKQVTLAWDANSCPVTGLSTLRVARYDGVSTWQDEGNTATTGSTAAGTITSSMVSNFSPFTFADITVLPIELLDFQANYDGTNVNCTWATASELNNDFFTIERTTDGLYYIEIGKLNGAGTTNLQHDYAFPDHQPVTGQSYYRLRQTDYNGEYTYSPLRPINIGQGTNLHIDFIGQGNGQLAFNYTLSKNNSATLMVHDMTGRLVYSLPISGEKITIDNSLWSKGIYTVLITDGKDADQRKFVLE